MKLKTFDWIDKVDGVDVAMFAFGVDKERLKKMIADRDYRNLTISALSFYFETNQAEKLLEKLEEVKEAKE